MLIYLGNGKVKAKGKYIEQNKDSVWNYFNDEEKIISVESFKNGVNDGVWINYYENGNVKSKRKFSKGKEIESKSYDENGKSMPVGNK